MFAIYTDTSANLPERIIQQYGLHIVPLHYMVNGTVYPSPEHDAKPLEGRLFYAVMRQGASVQTSMTNTTDFCTAFEESLSEGTDVIYIGMSSGISGTHYAAVQAANEMRKKYPDRKVAIIDTRAASLGEGLPVLFAARMREAGASFEEVAAQTEKNSQAICQYFTVEDLMYLKRGGRISGAAAFVGNILQVKPILKGDEEGRIILSHKERGRKRALEALAAKYRELVSDTGAAVGIAHADSVENAEYLAQRIREAGHREEILIEFYEPVTGSHVGPGTIALFFYGKHR